MKKYISFFTLSFIMVFLSSFVLKNVSSPSLTPVFGVLETGSYTLEEIMSQDKIRVFQKGIALEDNEIKISSYSLLLVPRDKSQASLVINNSSLIAQEIQDFISKAVSGDKLILSGIKYRKDGLEERTLPRNVTLTVL